MGNKKHDKKAKSKGGKHLPPKVTKAPKVAKPSKKKGKAEAAVEPEVIVEGAVKKGKGGKKSKRFPDAPADANEVAAESTESVAKASDEPALSDKERARIDDKLKAQRAARKLLKAELGEGWPTASAEAVDLGNHPLVTAWNLLRGVETGSFLTSTEEVEAAVASISKDAPMPTVPEQVAKLTKAKKTPKGEAQVAEEVQTESGREFAVGAVNDAADQVDPERTDHGILAADDGAGEVERDHFGRPYVEYLDDKGAVKRKAYTRVTTYIDCLEDKTQLEKWKMRTLLGGAGLDLDEYRTDAERDLADSLIGQAREAVKTYDAALARIEKQQAKGKLDLGQHGLRRAEAKKVQDDALNTIAQTALDLGGVHERAQKGTDLHALTERYDEGDLKVDEFIEQNGIDDVSAADLRAYAAKMTELGIEHVAIEQLVVVDALGVAGTLDRASLFKFPGSGRRIRTVADIKTGRVDYSAGKIGMQLYIYACGEAYDHTEATVAERRSALKLSKTQALLIHLPQGEARCEVYVVDIGLAAQGARLAREVRDWRNTGKRVYNLSTPITAEAPTS